MPYRILYSDELAHHGVQGQQWGVQNGPPYPLDRSISTGSKLHAKRASVKKTAKETAKRFKSMNMVTENADPWHNNRDERAAITGIKALIETYGKTFEEVDPENKDDQFWFLIEDQTVGLGSISDLANQGKTKSEIKELINNADMLRNNGYEDIPGVFQLYWASRYPKIDEYISKCVEIANDNEVKHFYSNDYLIHHGVQGQQWGVQNGPPYPLDRSISTGSRLKNADNTGKLPVFISANPAYLVYDLFAVSYNAIEKSIKNNRAEKFAERYKDLEVSKIASESKLPKIVGDHTEKDDMKIVNNKGDSRSPERSHNCVLCSVAYDLRRKGYDVVAGDNATGLTDKDIKSLYKGNVRFNKISSLYKGDKKINSADVRSIMYSATKNGDRGLFICAANGYTSHSIAWENNGKGIVFRDCQTNEVYSNLKMSTVFNYNADWAIKGSPARFVNTTNLEINTKTISDNKYIKVRGIS